MGIEDDDVRQVRERSDLVAIVSQHLQLKRVGRRQVGLCPFHNEKSPSFSVNAEEGLYYCFGCGAKGDVITFVREMEHLDFVGAVEALAARAGMTLRYTNRHEGESRKRRAQLIDVMEKAVDWYHARLLEAPDAAEARGYLRGRGFDGDLVRAYRLGWAPDDWDALARALDLSEKVLEETGLGFVNRRNRRQDAFRARILFPIFDAQGDPVALGGRIMPGGDGPKYKNSQETPIYTKSKVLYGLNWAKAGMVEAGEAIVCEGYTDVIGMAVAGMGRAVAPCGTALTEDHVRLLKRFVDRVVLAFDADAAGLGAAERFYEWEQTHEVDVAVAALPEGQDPGDLAREDPDRLREAVEQATPFLRFRVERALGAADLTSPEGRATAAEVAIELIAEHPKPLVQDQYLMEVADRCRVEPERLRAMLAGPRKRPAGAGRALGAPPRQARPPMAEVRSGPEIEALRLAVHRPGEVAEHLDAALFDSELAAATYEALLEAETLRDAIDSAPPDAADLLQRLVVEETESDASDVIAGLVYHAAGRALDRLESMSRANPDDLDVLRQIGVVHGLREKAQPPEPEPHALDELVRWIIGFVEEQP